MLLLLHTKNKKIYTLLFDKTWKPRFGPILWAHFWPFWLKHPKTRFFKQKPGLAPSLNFMQKIRKILDVAPEKNSGQTNKETEGKKQKKKTEGKYFISPSLYGSNEWISVIDTNKCKIAHEAEIRQRLRLYLFTYETFL